MSLICRRPSYGAGLRSRTSKSRSPYFDSGAQGLFLKGEKAEAELTEAWKSWRFEAECLPSRSDPRGRIVKVGSVRRVR